MNVQPEIPIFKVVYYLHSLLCVAFVHTALPRSKYSWSINHNLEHEFFCLGRLGSSGQLGNKSGFEFFWATFVGVFFNFLWAKKLNFVHMAFFLCLIQRSKEKQKPLTNLLNSMKGQKRQNSYVQYKQCNGVKKV